jgi:hypothetical protein
MGVKIVLAVLITLLGVASGPARAKTLMRVVQTRSIPGGRLQILQDARLTPALVRLFLRAGVDPALALPHDDPAARAFLARPLRPARLRQIGVGGHVILDVILNEAAPLAWVERRRMGGGSAPVYLVTTDDDAGFGSYSGRATRLYGVCGGRLRPVTASGAGGRPEPIVLVDTLKSRWRIIDSRPTHTLIEQIFCRPELDDERSGQAQGFLLTFITYRFDGRTWRMARRVTPGFWESDDDWPSRSAFPEVDGKEG